MNEITKKKQFVHGFETEEHLYARDHSQSERESLGERENTKSTRKPVLID